MFSSVDIGDPSTMLTAVTTFFTSFKTAIGPIALWTLGVGVVLSLFGIVYAVIAKGKNAVR